MKVSRKWSALAGLLLLAGFLAACAEREQRRSSKVLTRNGGGGGERGPAQPNGHDAAPPIQHHATSLLTRVDGEPADYGLYTYALFGYRVGAGSAPLPDGVRQRYAALLAAIAGSTAAAGDLEAAKIPRIEINLFCLPVSSAARPLNLENYSSDLAFKYRAIASRGVAADKSFFKKLSTGPGPFLISSLVPLNRQRTPGPMLFANLAGHNPAAMREVIAAYKRRIHQGLDDRAERFHPLRLALLSLILDADDNVKFVKDAVAGWLPNP